MEKPIIQSSHHGNHKQPQGLWETLVCKCPQLPCSSLLFTKWGIVRSANSSFSLSVIISFLVISLLTKDSHFLASRLQDKNRAVADVALQFFSLSRLSLPRGEKWTLAVKGLCEGVAKCDHTSLAARSAALHHHPGHLNQLDGALPVLQRLGQVQHLEANGFPAAGDPDMEKPRAVNEKGNKGKRWGGGGLPQKKKITLWVHCRSIFYFWVSGKNTE